MIKNRPSALIAGFFFHAAAFAASPKPPPSLSGAEIGAACSGLKEIARTAPPGERATTLKEALDRLIDERAKLYDGAVLRVESTPQTAKLGTKVNLTTEKKNVSFKIGPPAGIPGLEVADFAKEPAVRITRGNGKRVERKSAGRSSPASNEVTFRFTLVEPNLAEKNIHVEYTGWVNYRFTGSGAIEAARKDLEGVTAFSKSLETDQIMPEPPVDEVPGIPSKVEEKPDSFSESGAEKMSWHDFFVNLATGVLAPLLAAAILCLIRKWRQGR